MSMSAVAVPWRRPSLPSAWSRPRWWLMASSDSPLRATRARRPPRPPRATHRSTTGESVDELAPLIPIAGRPAGQPLPADLEELFQQRYEPMVRVAYGMLGSSQAAEDVVQDAFVEVHRRWDRIEEPAAYLRRAVVNGATSVLRRRVVEQRFARSGAEHSEDRPDEMRDAILALAPRYRAAIILRYYEDLPDHAIAAALGVRPATVRSLIHRAVHQLREAIT